MDQLLAVPKDRKPSRLAMLPVYVGVAITIYITILMPIRAEQDARTVAVPQSQGLAD